MIFFACLCVCFRKWGDLSTLIVHHQGCDLLRRYELVDMPGVLPVQIPEELKK